MMKIFLCQRCTSGYPARKFILQGNHITMFALSLDLRPSSHGLLAENCSPDIFGSNPKIERTLCKTQDLILLAFYVIKLRT
jgi:hypothetical protein